MLIKSQNNEVEYLSNCANSLREISELLCEVLPKYLAMPLFVPYNYIVDCSEEYGNDILVETKFMLEAPDGNEIHAAIENACNNVMEILLNSYNEMVSQTLGIIPNANNLLAKYFLSEDYITREMLNGTASLKRNLSPLFVHLSELSRLKLVLKSNFQFIQQGINNIENEEQKAGVKGFINGALIAFNPIIGIAKTVYDHIDESGKNQSWELSVNNFASAHDDYLNQWTKIRDIYRPIWENQQTNYISGKVNQIIFVALSNMLKDIQNNGFSLKDAQNIYSNSFSELKKVISELN